MQSITFTRVTTQNPPPCFQSKALEVWVRILSRAFAACLLLWPVLPRCRWHHQITLDSVWWVCRYTASWLLRGQCSVRGRRYSLFLWL